MTKPLKIIGSDLLFSFILVVSCTMPACYGYLCWEVQSSISWESSTQQGFRISLPSSLCSRLCRSGAFPLHISLSLFLLYLIHSININLVHITVFSPLLLIPYITLKLVFPAQFFHIFSDSFATPQRFLLLFST